MYAWVSLALINCSPEHVFEGAAMRVTKPSRGSLDDRYDPLEPTDRHFLIGNEFRHDLFYMYIRDRGGAYIGIGSEQNYSLIAAAQAEQAYIMDIDGRVLELHRLFALLVVASGTPAEFIGRFSEHAAGDTEALLAREHDVAERIKFFRSVRRDMHRHLHAVAKRNYPTWLSEQHMYQHVRGLFSAQRITIVPGNLQGVTTIGAIARDARERGIPVRTIYLSNAEDSLTHHARFFANLRTLAGVSETIILRTLYREDWQAADGLWSYQAQTLRDLAARMSKQTDISVREMSDTALAEGQLIMVRPDGALTTIGIE